MNPSTTENCPRCGEHDAVRHKLLLIDGLWNATSGKDPREEWFTDLRVDDVKTQARRNPPLEQFVDGYFCDRCGQGFVSEQALDPSRTKWRYKASI